MEPKSVQSDIINSVFRFNNRRKNKQRRRLVCLHTNWQHTYHTKNMEMSTIFLVFRRLYGGSKKCILLCDVVEELLNHIVNMCVIYINLM